MALSDLVVNIAGNANQFKRATGEVRGGLMGMQSTAQSVAAGVKGAFLGVAAALGPVVGIFAAFQGVKASIGLAAEAEQTAVSFEVLTGSVENATKLVNELRTMGAKTPFEFRGLARATKLLLNMGRTQEQVLGDLDMLSNVAAGDEEKLMSLARAFGQVNQAMKLTGEDKNQFIDAGFNPLNQIMKRTGENMSQLQARMQKGAVTVGEVEQAFRDATSEGGLFFQMNEKQSRTLAGRWSTLKDNITVVMTAIGDAIIEAFDFKGMLADGETFLASFRQNWLPQIRGHITTIAETWRSFTKFASDLWDNWLGDAVKNFAFFVENIGVFAAIAAEKFVIAGKQGARAFLKGFETPLAPFAGLGMELGAAVHEGKSFLEAWEDTVGRPGDNDTLRMLEQHAEKLALEFEKRFDPTPFTLPPVPPGGPGGGPKTPPVSPLKREDLKPNTAIEVGTREAFEKIFAALGGGQDKKQPEKETAKNTQEIADATEQMATAMEGIRRDIDKLFKKFTPDVQFAP